jgi:hypothetical protein
MEPIRDRNPPGDGCDHGKDRNENSDFAPCVFGLVIVGCGLMHRCLLIGHPLSSRREFNEARMADSTVG